jgi:hypothetical protein
MANLIMLMPFLTIWSRQKIDRQAELARGLNLGERPVPTCIFGANMTNLIFG